MSSPNVGGNVTADLDVLSQQLQELHEAKKRAATGTEAQDSKSNEMVIRGK